MDILPTPFPIAKEKILEDGETFVDSVTFQRGGCGGNFVCVLKTIYPQAEVQFVSRIAADPNSDFLIKEMEKYGVVQKFVRDPSVRCQITMAISYKDGERHFVTYLGGLANFCLEDISDKLFEGIDHLAYRGIWFAEKLLLQSEQFLRKAAALNIPISMDLGFDPIWNQDQTKPEIAQKVQLRKKAAVGALKYITYLFGNEREFLNLTGELDISEVLTTLLNAGVKNIIMHRGSKGAAVITQTEKKLPVKKDSKVNFSLVEVPAAKVKVINPVGSGDTFDSIFLAQILEQKTPLQAAAFACAGAAYSLQSPAGTKITLDAVQKFIQTVPTLATLYK